MDKRYTSNKLVQIIYGEAPFKEYFELDDAMESDPALRIEFRNLYDAVQLLPKVTITPSKDIIDGLISISKENLRPTRR